MDTAQGSLLVVDDNELNRDMLARRLARRGYTVAVAADGQQALTMLETQPFDLILLDIMMPGISGLDVLKILRERYSVAALPVIMATAKDQSEDIVAALQLGANDYVTKPLDFQVVLARMQTQLALKRATEEIHRLATQLARHNRFIRETFGRYLTDEVVASLLDSPAGLRLGGEERQVTMLMADLRGFTSLAGRLVPEQVVAILNRYLGTMVEVILQYQGTIDEFIGDAILVIFGAPIWRQDDAQRAVACAVAMQLAMSAVNEENRRAGLPDVEMGIGVHTGEVVVGNIGSHKRTKYGVVGSHVNLTSRIQSYTVGGQVLISEATRHRVEPLVQISRQMEVEAKGIIEPITLYELHSIGGSYNLCLPVREEALLPLQPEILVQYTVLEGEHVGRTVYQGSFVTLSARGGEIRSAHAVALWSNIKVRLLDPHGAELRRELYAKVLRHLPEQPGFYAHFTSVSPEAAAFFQRLLRP
jgi:class 3 adenylate cyclase